MNFKDAIKRKEQEGTEMEVTHKQINAAILRELPGLYEAAVAHFKNLASDTPINIVPSLQTKRLYWASNNENIGRIEVNDYTFSSRERIMSISLNPIIGYVGATAKIELNTSVLRGLPINKGGLFVDIAYRPDQRNAIKYMDFNNKVHEFNEDIAEQIMRVVFLDERPGEPNVVKW